MIKIKKYANRRLYNTETSTYTSSNILESLVSTISNALNFSGGDTLETDITNTNNIFLE